MKQIKGRLVWKCPKPFNTSSNIPHPGKYRIELCDLIRFKDYWYCGFHEGMVHIGHPAAKTRIIRSKDGVRWESVKVFAWDAGDIREPRFSITAEGLLMIDSIVNFISKEPRSPDVKYGIHADALPPEHPDRKQPPPVARYYQLDSPMTPESIEEARGVVHQSVTWLSEDGLNWGGAYACETGVNGGRWSTTWHNGMGYCAAYIGKDITGTLYRTRDGKSWRVLKRNFFPAEGKGILNETSIAFDHDNAAFCLARGSGSRNINPICGPVIMGIGKAPYYQEWEWKVPKVDWNGDGKLTPVNELLIAPFGGPKMIRLRDGRFVAAGRVLGPGQDDGTISLFTADFKKGTMKRFTDVYGNTYAGIVEHKGKIWTACLGRDFKGIVLAKVGLPG